MPENPGGAGKGDGVRALVRPGGFLDRFLGFCEPFEFPDSYAVFSLLACVSAAIDRRIKVNPDSEPACYPALYVILYGPSGTKKGGAIKYATWLFGAGINTVNRYPDDFTMEALFEQMAEDSEDGGRGARGVVVNEEFADLIGGAEYALRTTATLARLFDCRPTMSRRTRGHGLETINQSYLVILGATSPDWLELVDPRVLAGGFLRRLLLVVEYRPKCSEANPKRDLKLLGALSGEFAEKLGAQAFPAGCEMRLTAEARDAMSKWYDGLKTAPWPKRDERARHFASTIQEHVLRVAACIELLEGGKPDTLSFTSWNEARLLVESLVPGMLRAYRSLTSTPLARLKAMAVRLTAENGGTMDPSDLSRAIMRSGGVDQDYAIRVYGAAVAEGSLVWDAAGKLSIGDS